MARTLDALSKRHALWCIGQEAYTMLVYVTVSIGPTSSAQDVHDMKGF